MSTHAPRPSGMWQRLAEHAAQPQSQGVWSTLAERADPALYRPCAIPDVAEEQVVEAGQELTVIRSPRGHYLRLTSQQRTIWHQMDGTRTIAQLATGAFLQFHQLLPVGELVSALHDEGFLTDQPVGVYRALVAHLEANTAEGWGRRVLRFITGQRFHINQIDGIYRVLYRTFGWLLFTPVFVALWGIVSVVGFGAFIGLLTTQTGGAGVSAGGLPFQVATLWLALLISFLLHESSHALAVKHFGRMLRGGGAMLYFGAPAFYVDTSDIWRSPRRARVLVSAAGPMSDMFIGGLAALFALLQPEALLAPVAAKLAFTCYIATLFNFNPLLELDGYYILVDMLRLPDLRRRALEFVRGPLWGKFVHGAGGGQAAGGEGRISIGRWSFTAGQLTREERIFTLYGALTLVYTAVAVVFAVQFWRRWLWGLITHLWALGGWLNQAAAAALVALVVVPILAGLALVVWGVVRSAVAWLIRNGYGRRPSLVAGISATVVIALAVALGQGGPWFTSMLPLVLWSIALAALIAVRPDYRGAAIAPALDALLPATILAGLASLVRVLPLEGGLWQLADGLALLFLLLSAFVAQLDVSVRYAPARIQFMTALMIMLSFAVGGSIVAQELGRTVAGAAGAASEVIAAATPQALLVGAPAFFGTFALAMLLPYMVSLTDSRLVWSWLLFWGAALAETTAYIVDLTAPSLGLDMLTAGLWAAAWISHLATLRQIAPEELPWKHVASLSERERLARAFQLCYAGCYRLLRAVYGARRTRDLDDRMDVLAATANWDVRLDRDQAEIGLRLAGLPLDAQGARFAEVLRYTVATIEQIAGESFARRAIQAAYDALPWPERETAGRLCFPDTPWAKALSHAFGDAQQARLRLLREVDILLTCDDDELVALARSAHSVQVRAGERLLRAGELPSGVWIVEAGEVLAKNRTDVVRELHRASAFGAEELLNQQPAALTYRASVDATVLFIPQAEFRALARESAPHAAEATSAAATLRLLERVPIFAQLPRNTLRGLAHIATARQFAPREVIIRQHVPSGMFYIIQQGRAVVLTRTEGAAGQERAPLRLVARLGPEEFFGEVELVDGTPPMAHVLAETRLSVLALPHDALRALILGDGAVADSLRQISSGRVLALQG